MAAAVAQGNTPTPLDSIESTSAPPSAFAPAQQAVTTSPTRSPIPLTTIFTPPTTCLDIVTYDGESFWQGGVSQKGDAGCYPSGFYKIFNSYYSPGICPHSWTSVSQVDHSSGFDAMCCPSSYFLFTSSDAEILGNVCASLIASDLTNVWSTSTLDAGPLPNPHPLITVAKPRSSNTVWADVIQVQWQSKDKKIISLLKQTSDTAVSTSRAVAGSTSSQQQPTALHTLGPTSQSSSNGISSGAKAGIGVGVALGVIAFAVFAVFFFFQRRRRRCIATPAEVYKGHYAYEMPHEHDPVQSKAVELDARNVEELEATQLAAEMETTSPIAGKHEKGITRNAFAKVNGAERYS